MAGPYKGFGLYTADMVPENGIHFDVYKSAERMAAMGADVIKLPLTWSGRQGWAYPKELDGRQHHCRYGLRPIQGPDGTVEENADFTACPANPGSVNAPWSFQAPDRDQPNTLDQIEFIRKIYQTAKDKNPNFKGVIIGFGGIPSDIDGGNAGGKHPGTLVGCSTFGSTAARILNELGDICLGIELRNEPNMKASVPGGTEIAPQWYAAMAAYIIFWIYSCCGGLNSNGDLKKKVLLGAVATSSTHSNNWTDGLSPANWTQVMGGWVYLYLDYLLPNDSVLRDKLYAAWRLSIHPYPNRGEYDIIHNLPPTDPNNESGDRYSYDAASNVWGQYATYQSMFPTRKMWITETGVSSRKLYESGQSGFFALLGTLVKTLYNAGDTRLEGVVNWGFTDCDPALHTPTTGYYEFGVVRKTDGSSYKLAGDTIKDIYENVWI